MSKVKKVFKNVGQSLGLVPTNKELSKQYEQQAALVKAAIPEPPAPVASAARATAGGEVVVGTSAATKDGRVSGRTSGRGGGSGGNPLGGLGRGGLSI